MQLTKTPSFHNSLETKVKNTFAKIDVEKKGKISLDQLASYICSQMYQDPASP